MKNTVKKFMKKQWLLLWVVAVLCGYIWMFASAESMKTLTPLSRVVVSKEGHGSLFSSNLLLQGGDEKYLPVDKSTLTDTDIFLWNYDVLDSTTFYTENINYKIEAVFTDSEGNPLDAATIGQRVLTIEAQNANAQTTSILTLNSTTRSGEITGLTLPYNSTNGTQRKVTLKYSNNWNLSTDANICIQLKVIPTTNDVGASYSDLYPISRIIGIKTTNGSISSGWTVKVDESDLSNNPTGYDAYNLVASGSGSAEITITWDTTKVELNKYFYDDTLGVYGFASGEVVDSGKTGDWYSITINADTNSTAKNNRNRYCIQIYKLGKLDDTTTPSNWNFVAINETAAQNPSAWVYVMISQ